MPANRGSYRHSALKAITVAAAILSGVYQFFSVLSRDIPNGNYGAPITVIVFIAALMMMMMIMMMTIMMVIMMMMMMVVMMMMMMVMMMMMIIIITINSIIIISILSLIHI